MKCNHRQFNSFLLLGLVGIWSILPSCSVESSYEDRKAVVSKLVWVEDSIELSKLRSPSKDSLSVQAHRDSVKNPLAQPTPTGTNE